MSDLTIRNPAKRVIAAKLVADELKSIESQAKSEVLELADSIGATTFTVKDDDGAKLGTVSKSDGKTAAKVTDPSALLMWVAENRPDQLVQVVADAYVKSLLKLAVEHGAAVDENTGEVVPGIEVTQGSAYVSARPTPEARARMRELLDGSPLLELAGGTDA